MKIKFLEFRIPTARGLTLNLTQIQSTGFEIYFLTVYYPNGEQKCRQLLVCFHQS